MAEPVLKFPGETAPAAESRKLSFGQRLRKGRRFLLLVVIPLIAAIAILRHRRIRDKVISANHFSGKVGVSLFVGIA